MPGDTHRGEPEWHAVLRTDKADQTTGLRSCSALQVGVKQPNTDPGWAGGTPTPALSMKKNGITPHSH